MTTVRIWERALPAMAGIWGLAALAGCTGGGETAEAAVSADAVPSTTAEPTAAAAGASSDDAEARGVLESFDPRVEGLERDASLMEVLVTGTFADSGEVLVEPAECTALSASLDLMTTDESGDRADDLVADYGPLQDPADEDGPLVNVFVRAFDSAEDAAALVAAASDSSGCDAYTRERVGFAEFAFEGVAIEQVELAGVDDPAVRVDVQGAAMTLPDTAEPDSIDDWGTDYLVAMGPYVLHVTVAGLDDRDEVAAEVAGQLVSHVDAQ
ncbi:hypothetical protein [Demequina maris]|uniref:hypothetical protein n=1 Tax=Demequina maris TaxID=1638982 RepID=UPI000782F655|nr:hypothetical protein [Demequina maris]